MVFLDTEISFVMFEGDLRMKLGGRTLPMIGVGRRRRMENREAGGLGFTLLTLAGHSCTHFGASQILVLIHRSNTSRRDFGASS